MNHGLPSRVKCCGVLVGMLPILLIATFAGAGEEPPPILSAAEIDYPPFSFIETDGRATGFSVELLHAALAAMGRQVTFRTGPWAEIKGWLEEGQVEALPLVGRTPEREGSFDFTFPYMSLHGAIVVREERRDIHTLGDLQGLRVAVMQGDNAEEFLRRGERGLEIHTTVTFEEALRELAAGRHDAVVVQRLVALRLLQETGLTNLRIVDRPVEDFRQDFCFAVRKGDSQTLALLNEGLALVIADGAFRHLHARWFAALELPTHRRLVVGGDHNYPPFEYLDERGRPTGYNVELTRAIARELELDIEIRLGPWAEIRQALASGEIDAIQGMLYSPERNLEFSFTPPHTVNYYVSVVRRGEGEPPVTVGELAGKRLVVQQGDLMHDFAMENGLEEQLSLVDAQEDALRELAAGMHDCALVARLTALYWLEKYGWDNLWIAPRPLLSADYCYAGSHDNQALLAQFSEGLKVLKDTGAYRRIRNKWLAVYEDEPPTLFRALRYSAMIFVPLLLILLAAAAWSWSLRRQVARRTAELRQSEEFQRAMIACSPVALYSIDLEGKVQSWNVSAERIFGWTAEEVIGKPMPSVPQDRQEEFASLRQQLMVGQGFVGREVIRMKKDGAPFDGNLSAAPIRDDAGRTIGVMGAMLDITQHKQAERALRRHQSMLARTERLAHVGSWEWDVTTDTVTWSDELFHIFQRDPAAGAPPFAQQAELFLPEGMERLRQAAEAAISQGTPYELELRARRRDGTIRHCLVRGYPENGSGGKFPRFYGSLQDITEFKLAQQRIEHLNHVLRAIRDVNQLIVHERHEGALIRQGCRLLVDNRGYATALIVLTDSDDRPRCWAEAGLGPTFESLVASFEQGELPACFERARNAGKAVLIDDRPRLCGACAVAAECSENDSLIIRLTNDGLAFGYLAVSMTHDLSVDLEEQHLFAEMAGDLAYALRVLQADKAREASERQSESLQAQLLQAQKMESVGRLAGGVAHDFNNMLGVILGYTQLAMDRVEPEDELRADLEEILQAAHRSANITRQLLAFARRQTIAPRVLDLNETMEGMLKMLRRLIGEDLDLAWLPGSALWPVNMDPGQLDQLLANLCVNARDAIAGVGKITIETGKATFTPAYCATHAEFVPGDYVRLAVSDNGCGMDQETLAQLFEPFFTTKEVGRGTGLGLSTVYGIVKQNEGFVNVYSEPGKGTTFKLYLPRYGGETEAREAEHAVELPRSRGETVLLVEDETAILRMSGRMLEQLGYRVLAANRPEEAVRLAAEHDGRIALLITDVVMPQMNGRELAAQLQGQYPELAVLFMSGYTANAIAHHGVLDEGMHFIEKPFAIEELAVKVRQALGEN